MNIRSLDPTTALWRVVYSNSYQRKDSGVVHPLLNEYYRRELQHLEAELLSAFEAATPTPSPDIADAQSTKRQGR